MCPRVDPRSPEESRRDGVPTRGARPLARPHPPRRHALKALRVGRLGLPRFWSVCVAGHSLCTAPHRTASHRIASHRIASHDIASHHIILHRIASHRTAPHCNAPHRITAGHPLRRPFLLPARRLLAESNTRAPAEAQPRREGRKPGGRAEGSRQTTRAAQAIRR